MCLNLPELKGGDWRLSSIMRPSTMHGNEFSVKPLDNKAWIDDTLRLVTHHVR